MPDQNHKKKSRLRLIIPALLFALAASCLAGALLVRDAASEYYRQHYLDFSFTTAGLSYEETTAELDNPGGGFYCLHGYLLSEETTNETLDELLARDIRLDEGDGLVLLEINLLRYRDAPLSARALAQLERILLAWEKADYQIILRFLYDWDGNAAATDPEDLAQITEHMTQAAPVVNAHAASVYTMQGTFAGSWGEMHGSKHTTPEAMCTLMEHLNEVIDPGIFLAVRTPAHRRTILNSAEAFPEKNTLAVRLGLYNDGMLGSETDLGTYGEIDKHASVSLGDHWLRAQELAYQDEVCRHVPNGGEAVIDNPLNDLDAALEAFRTMHVSYLNCKYQLEVLDKWRETPIQTDDKWNGMDGFTYIGRHLGTRYRCTEASAAPFDCWKRDTASLSFTLANTAFSGSCRPLICRIRVVSDADESVVFEQVVGTDSAENSDPAGRTGDADSLRALCNGEKLSLSLELPLRTLPDGAYRVYLSCETVTDGHALALANSLPHTESGYEIASFSLSRTPTEIPSGKALIERYLSHLSASEKPQALAK